MKITRNILKDIGDIQESGIDIVNVIKEHIGEVEDFHNIQDDYKDIIIGEILEKKDHPNAEKLGIYKVRIGDAKEVQVLAGDKTLEVGDKVAYLKPGAIVPYSIYTEETPFVIEKIKMRGEDSNGMMGSERELNLGPDHTKVLRLPKDAPVGKDFASYYGMDDFVIDIENKALTNRGDLFGMLGLSREISAVFNRPFVSPEWYSSPKVDIKPENNCLSLEVSNDAESLCPRYMAITMDNIEVKESPLWLKSILIKTGNRPINNIVDITNYLSALIGQPLHAFDYDKIISKDTKSENKAHINIRMAKDGENIMGLDNKLYELNDRVMVIADSSTPLAIAGIIGGMDTQVDENTKRIVIECANFDKSNIRKTAMMLGISTEAATKNKHALDPNQCLPTIIKTVEMVKELANGSIASDLVDIYPNPAKPTIVDLDINRLNSHLGTELSVATIETILTNLEYSILSTKKDIIKVQAPSWRKDINIREDIHEDIGRIYGYNNIKIELPKKDITAAKSNDIFKLKSQIRDILSNSGANELDTYSFVSPEMLKNCNLNIDLAYKIKNAQAPELSLMRTSLIPSILTKAQENLQRGFDRFILYEMNLPHIKNILDGNNLPLENWHLSMVFVSERKELGSAYYISKHYLEKIFESLSIKDIHYDLVSDVSQEDMSEEIKNTLYMFDPNTSAIVTYKENVLGVIGEIDNRVKDNFKLPKYCAALDINIQRLSEIQSGYEKYIDMPKFPESIIDLCYEVVDDIHYQDIEDTIKKCINTDDLWGRVECIDIYKGKDGDKTKKVTVRVSIRNYMKTLTVTDTSKIVEKISKKLKNTFEAKLV